MRRSGDIEGTWRAMFKVGVMQNFGYSEKAMTTLLRKQQCSSVVDYGRGEPRLKSELMRN